MMQRRGAAMITMHMHISRMQHMIYELMQYSIGIHEDHRNTKPGMYTLTKVSS